MDNIAKLQWSHHDAVLRYLATGEFNPLEHREAVEKYVIGTGAVSTPPPTTPSASPPAEAAYGEHLVPGSYVCGVTVEAKRALGDYRRVQ